MPSRVLSSLALLVFAVTLERFLHYGYRSFIALVLTQMFALPRSDVSSLYGQLMGASVVGSLLAGGLAFVLPPRWIAIAGALLASVSLLSLTLARTPSAAIAALILADLGSGIVRPCIYGYSARVLTYEGDTDAAPASMRRFLTFGALSALLIALTNGAAAISVVFFMSIVRPLGDRAGFVVAGLLMLLVPVGFGVSIFVDGERLAPTNTPPQNTAYRTEPGAAGGPASPPFDPAPILLALGIALALALQYVVQQGTEWLPVNGNYRTYGLLTAASTVASVITGFGLLALLLSLASRRAAVSLATFIGAGLSAFGAGSLLMVAGGIALSFLGALITGAAESLTALAIVYAALASRTRAATLIVAAYSAIVLVGSMAGTWVAHSSLALMVAGALLLIALGVALLVLARRIRAVFEPA